MSPMPVPGIPTPQVTTEAIIQRLFKIAQSTNKGATQYKVISRRMRHFKDVSPSEIPAFFQFQNPVRGTSGGDRGLPKDVIGVSWFVYLPKSQGLNDVVSPALNNYYDALSTALLTTGFDKSGNAIPGGLLAGTDQDLGFTKKLLCYKDGDGLTDEGLLDTPSLIHIPIKILVGI